MTGLKFFKKIRPLLDSLHDISTARDKSGYRDLHTHQYGVLVLMWMLNPILTFQRGLQQANTPADVQKKFGGDESVAGLINAKRPPSRCPSRGGVVGSSTPAKPGR